jgi:hypothetical protein
LLNNQEIFNENDEAINKNGIKRKMNAIIIRKMAKQ